MDDVIVHRLGEDDYLLVINAGTREKDFNWVRDHTRQFDCTVENLSDDFTQIAIQGPKAVNLLQKLTDADLSAVKFYWLTRGTVCGLHKYSDRPHRLHRRRRIRDLHSQRRSHQRPRLERDSRSGQGIRNRPLRSRVRATRCVSKPGCRSTATRFPTRSTCGKPASIASARWRSRTSSAAHALEKAEGRRGKTRALVGLEMLERGIARDGYKVLDLAGQEIGYVTSGSPAPFLKKNIALAYVPIEFVRSGHRTESGNTRPGREGTGRADPVLQETEKGLTTEDTEKHRGTRKGQSSSQSQELKAHNGLSRPTTSTPKNTSGSKPTARTPRSASPATRRSRWATSFSSICPRSGAEITVRQNLWLRGIGEGRLRSLRARLRYGDRSQRRSGDMRRKRSTKMRTAPG